ncbi:hypothetical protein HYALB_00008013 [Hymenoscyphus albidus]|uniref:Uncharacterized protein n=1 Tax=Hymenoscyphus albidus TaxID=595503 RepID=A0A9N9LED1_9HELO|nr:hypothetical protein HYALB_00008013 [Hymenoscyphus albidus]
MVPMILFTITKVWTKWKMTKTFQLDDEFMIFGTLVGIAQTIVLWIEVDSGLGRPRDEVTDTQFKTFQMASTPGFDI